MLPLYFVLVAFSRPFPLNAFDPKCCNPSHLYAVEDNVPNQMPATSIDFIAHYETCILHWRVET
ncbi:hypothetical protein Hypma_007592 [Hypsizygus marmoreus]|uniref:Secreted protein n=1 Tax=Hypsizygus marmoreus TaxID=39966 RepID=A0A369JV95_HYPMA|nr:hypothetical protein Hypma_007592 [Hypsizygus marmoreus]